jgi:hypothetical protein
MKNTIAWKSSLGLTPILLLGLLAGCNRQTDTSAVAAAPAPAAAPAAAPAPAPVATDEMYVDSEPPPPQTEVVVASPGPDYVWIGGYWGFNSGRREWVRGRWERPPHAHATWVQPRWEHRGHGYVFVRGTWR